MRSFLRPSALAAYLIILAIFTIGTSVYRELDGLESRMWKMREGFLNEIAHLMASSLALSLQHQPLTADSLSSAFKSYESMDARGYYGPNPSDHRSDVALQFLFTDAAGTVLYDSNTSEQGRNLSENPEIEAALKGQYRQWMTEANGITEMFVAIPVWVNQDIVGVIKVGKPATIVQPILREAQRSIIMVGIAGVVVALLCVLMVFLFLLKPLELWFAYAGLFKDKKFPERPKLRRSRLGVLGEIIDHMYQALSGRSYIEEVLGNFGHEIQNPMTTIRGILRILERPIPSQDRDQFLVDAHQQLDRIRRIVDRMVALASLEKRNSLKKLQPVKLSKMLKTVMEDLSPIARNAQIALQVKVPPNLKLHCDSFLVAQAISNLILNAIEHSAPSGEIEISIEVCGTYLEISVRDHGEGIPPMAINRIFEKLYTLPRVQSDSRGTGLGLNFVQQIVELHYGEISVVNHPEGGVHAMLRFPETLVSLN